MNITKGIIESAQKVVLYGPEGIGKSTFASKFPNPLFIDTEGSTKHLDVARFDAPSSWTMLMQQVQYVIDEKPCGTLIIDTADWAETLCKQFVISSRQIRSIEDPGYGKGYTYLAEEWGKFLNKLEEVIEAGVNVVVTAHAMIRKFEKPDEMGAYDRWELKLEKKTSAITKEWADMMLFANYKTTILTDSKTKSKKATGGERMMYTSHHPAWDAKNRHNLPDELPLSFDAIASVFVKKEKIATQETEKKTATETPVKESVKEEQIVKEQPAEESKKEEIPKKKEKPHYLPKPLEDLMKANKVTEHEIKAVVYQKGYYPYNTPIDEYDPQFVQGVLIGAWHQVFESIKELREVTEEVPF